MSNPGFHPFSEVFPLMGEEELAALAEDIRQNGLHEPIIRHRDGTILDGRNRYIACQRAGVEPKYDAEPYLGDDPLGFVISCNYFRRHLKESQRALAAARIATMPQGGRTDLAEISAKSQTEAAELFKVSRGSVQHAATVLREGAPIVVATVESGAVPVSVAAKAVKSTPIEVQKEWTSPAEIRLAGSSPPPSRKPSQPPVPLALVPKPQSEAMAALTKQLRSEPGDTLDQIAQMIGEEKHDIRALPLDSE